MLSEIAFAVFSILVLAGASILVASLFPCRRVIYLLPKGRTRNRWKLMCLLTLFFLIGYVAYFSFFLVASSVTSADILVAVIFFLGSLFVWIANKVTVKTILDIRQIEKLKMESITDPLTGIFNRRYLFRRLDEEVRKVKRYSSALSLVLFDIDHFKEVNDKYGHLVGDKVLVEVCRVIQENVRRTDFVARYGGEEICVLMPNTKLAKAKSVAERIRGKIEQSQIGIGGSSLNVTLSAGVASFSESDSIEDLIRKADANLYRAKEAGRNRVVAEEIEKQKTSFLTTGSFERASGSL
ncbi:MAG: GGDEF domain-containing protein [Pyrinomonadaceae bacterium]|nr:GGDEF domain-containing protein [Pyrinomonadaceae bacterium]